MLIFEKSVAGRSNEAQAVKVSGKTNIDAGFFRREKAVLPEVSELQALFGFVRTN